MEKTKKGPLYSVLFMVILSLVLTFLLAALNGYTEPLVAFNQDIELKGKILDVFMIEPASDKAVDIDSSFNEKVEIGEFEGKPMYIHKEAGKEVGYAVPFAGPGLWGEIEGYVGINAELNEILGIQFTKQSETPGLGGRIEETEYRDQYRNVDISDSQAGEFVINNPAPGGNIDAISGATQTSSSVTDMINDDLNRFIESKGGN